MRRFWSHDLPIADILTPRGQLRHGLQLRLTAGEAKYLRDKFRQVPGSKESVLGFRVQRRLAGPFDHAWSILSERDLPVRIGIERDVASVTLESAALFTIEGRRVRSASFSAVVILTGTGNEIRRDDIERRMAIELDAGIVLVRSMDARVGVEPGREPLRVNGRTFRGSVEVRGIPAPPQNLWVSSSLMNSKAF